VSLVSAALELLKQLLKTPTRLTKRSLLAPDGIRQSRIFTQNTGTYAVVNVVNSELLI
jgi:hypothetical protein